MLIALAGSSNSNRLFTVANTVVPTPYANTSQRISGGAATLPTNAAVNLANGLVDLLGNRVDLVNDWCGGGPLLPSAGAPYWFDEGNPPMTTFAPMLAGTKLDLIWFVGGFREAQTVETDEWIAAILQFKARLCWATKQAPDDVPMMVSIDPPTLPGTPGGTPTNPYVIQAAERIGRFSGMFTGPELWDLTRDPSDTVHLDEAGRLAFVARGIPQAADLIAKYRPLYLRAGISSAPVVLASTWAQWSGNPADNVAVGLNNNFAFRFAAVQNFMLSSVQVNVASVAGAGTWELYLFSDAGGSPGSLIGSAGAPVTISASGVVSLPAGVGQIGVAGVHYWVVANPAVAGTNVNLMFVPPNPAFMSGRGAPITSITNNLPSGNQFQIEIDAA